MKEIKLTQGKVALVDDEDYEELNKYKWCAHKEKTNIYALRHGHKVDGSRTMIRMHREIMKPVNGLSIDHIDSDGLNNQRCNLRVCTHAKNMRHVRPRKGCSSIFKGVTWHKKIQKWRAYIMLNSKQISLGCYHSEVDAARAYDSAAINLFGSFALLNLT